MHLVGKLGVVRYRPSGAVYRKSNYERFVLRTHHNHEAERMLFDVCNISYFCGLRAAHAEQLWPKNSTSVLSLCKGASVGVVADSLTV